VAVATAGVGERWLGSVVEKMGKSEKKKKLLTGGSFSDRFGFRVLFYTF
jgi:hypothetical protein